MLHGNDRLSCCLLWVLQLLHQGVVTVSTIPAVLTPVISSFDPIPLREMGSHLCVL